MLHARKVRRWFLAQQELIRNNVRQTVMKSICIRSSNLWEECAPALTLLTTVCNEENGLEICLYHIFYFSSILNLVLYILQIFQQLLCFYWTFAFKSSWHLNFNNQVIFSSVQSLSHVWLFATPWIAARQASLSITNSRSSLRLTSIELVMPSSHLILCRPLLLLPPIPPSIRVFSNESTLLVRWPKYWSFSFSIIPSKEIPGLISFRMDWLDLLAVQGTVLPYFYS